MAKAYLILVFILATGYASIIFLSYNRTLQIIAVIITALVYLLWGVLHHQKQTEFFWRLFSEYALVALVGAVAVVLLLLRA